MVIAATASAASRNPQAQYAQRYAHSRSMVWNEALSFAVGPR